MLDLRNTKDCFPVLTVIANKGITLLTSPTWISLNLYMQLEALENISSAPPVVLKAQVVL